MNPTTDTLICHRSSYRIIRTSGADIRAYLQTQITQDVQQLHAEQAMYAVTLTPQGKAVSDMYLMEQSGDILLIVTADTAEALVHRLRRFALGHDVRIGISEQDALLSIQGHESASIAQHFTAQGCTTVAMPEAREQGYWSIVAQQDISTLLQPFQAYHCHDRDMEQACIFHGTPRFMRDWDSSISPMYANIEEMHGIRFDKGCYVGQEIMSRMHWRGSVRKKLYLIEIPAMPQTIPCPILSTVAIGTLTSVATQHGRIRGIASLPVEVVEQGSPLTLETQASPITILHPCQLEINASNTANTQ